MNQSNNTEEKLQYALGVLETVKVLLDSKSSEVLNFNIEHIKKILPVAIEELKSENSKL
jgi:hypothetical protein